MMSLKLLIIIGACLTFSTFVVSNPTPTLVPVEEIVECQRLSEERGSDLRDCISREYTEEQMNETRRIYNDTKCLDCKHFCRKQDAVVNCIREGTEVLKVISNKARHMVPFMGQFIEALISVLCDNDAEILEVLNDEINKQCFRDGVRHCKSHLDFMEDLDRVAFCDFTTPENDHYTTEYVCRKTKDFLECADKGIEACSLGVKNSVTSLTTKLANSDFCAKYY